MNTDRTLDEDACVEEDNHAADSPEGKLIANRFEVGRCLGEGGMGAVFRAYDRELDQTVAVKFLSRFSSEKPQELLRFRREAQLSRLVTHTNVLRVFEFGDSAYGPYLVMELIEGESLDTLLSRKNRMDSTEAIGLIRCILEGLGAAHLAGIVHRDIKPANVLVSKTGRVVLTDFGIARQPGRPGVTHTGAIIGTPAYMAPEQLHGGDVDSRTDLYAVGAMAYAMVTGVAPIGASIDRKKLVGASPRLVKLIEACLRHDRAERPASTVEAIAILQEQETKRHRVRWVVAMVILIGVLAGTSFWVQTMTLPISVVVDPVQSRDGVPDWAASATQDILTTALAAYALPHTRRREQRLQPILSKDTGGFTVTLDEKQGDGTTLFDATKSLLDQLELERSMGQADFALATARALWSAGDQEEAMLVLDKIPDQGGFQADVLRALVLPDGDAKARQVALQLATYEARAPGQKAIVAAANALLADKPMDEALLAMERARGRATRGDAELAIFGYRLLWKASRKQEALAVLEEQTRARPKDPVGWLILGRAYLRNKDLDAAGRTLDRYLTLHPGSAYGCAWRGEVFYRTGDYARAEEWLKRADTIGPFVAGMRLAVLLSLQQKDFTAARKAARRGLGTDGLLREAATAWLTLVEAEEKGDSDTAGRLRKVLEDVDD